MCFNWKITLSIPHLSGTEKQGIRLKMHEMAILEIQIFKNVLGTILCSQTPLETRTFKHLLLALVILAQIHMTSVWGSQTWGLCTTLV